MPSPRRTTARSAVVGLLAGALTIGVAELVAALLQRSGRAGGTASPVVAVGGAFIDRTPPWLKDLAISTFGTADKTALLTGIALVLALVAAVAGVLAARRRTLGLLVVVLLAGVGTAAVLSRPGAGALDAFPTVVGAVAGLLSLDALTARARAAQRPGMAVDRRSFVQLAIGTGAVAVVGGGLSRLVGGGSRAATASRDAVVLPAPTSAATAAPASGTAVEGISPLVTPVDAFYRIDTALAVPQMSSGDWRLRIHGMVDREVEITYAELLALPLVDRMVTLSCVSNEVGGDLIGNQVWRGHLLRELLAKAGPQQGADMVLSKSVDGWTAGTPLEALTDPARDAMLAVGMDGRPLPVVHGFPVRMVVPGLYGYVSATKWVVDLEVTRFDRAQGYWTPRGWSALGPIKTESRIDVPRSGASVTAGRVAVAGVAWAPHRGIGAVEVKVDDGPWQRADVGAGGSADTWRQWVWAWDATPGDHTLAVRASDGTGEVQTSEQAPPAPDGASGWHTVDVTVA
ncbi:MAG: molybdopterin-dependent oxidoreductase [Actinomycetota bacterium]